MKTLTTRIVVICLLAAAFLSLGTLAIQTGSLTLFDNQKAVIYNGAPCAFKQYGFPFKAVATIEEPCAYYVTAQAEPQGIELGYTYIDTLTLLGDIAAWSFLLISVTLLSAKTPLDSGRRS